MQKFTGKAPRQATLNKIQDFINNSPRGAGAGPPQDMDRQEREYNARAVLEESGHTHAIDALQHVATGHYEGEHWLGSFAVYLLTEPK